MAGIPTDPLMSKFASFAEYPPRSLAGAEAALLTAWASLERFHSELVLVGGLAVKYLTTSGQGLLPGAVTMDVDLGVTLATEGGQYGSLADDLSGQGFRSDQQGRFARRFENLTVFLDFLTEHPGAMTGTAVVDGIPAGIFPGVGRALATRRMVWVEGTDVFGVRQRMAIPISGIGALLVLKLNAFAGRQQAKDAYDLLLTVTQSVDGAEAAVASFREEVEADNPGIPRALEALRKHFTAPDQSGPLRCAAFALEGLPAVPDLEMRRRQIIERMVTVGQALLSPA